MALNVGYVKSIHGILKILEIVSMQPLELKENVIVGMKSNPPALSCYTFATKCDFFKMTASIGYKWWEP